MLSGNVDPGDEVADGVCGMTIDELGEGFGHQGVRFDAGDLAVLDQRGETAQLSPPSLESANRAFLGMGAIT